MPCAGTRADDADRSRLAEFLLSVDQERRLTAPLAGRQRPGSALGGPPGRTPGHTARARRSRQLASGSGADPGGSYGNRAWHIAVFALIGAALTALGFGIGEDAWGWLVLAAAAVTLVAGLSVAFGVYRFVAAYLLNIWFIVALAVASGFHHAAHITSYTWAQVLAWVGGAALWIAVTFIAWLIRGRQDRPQTVAELPGDTSRRKLTGPLIMFAVLRAIVIAVPSHWRSD